MPSVNDPQTVRQHYATDESLRIRQETHDKYTVPKMDFIAWALKCVDWKPDQRLLDVGCGPGRYYDTLKSLGVAPEYYGLDVSPGMLEKHTPTATLTVGDAQYLPYLNHTFDVVMANHMLYHVPDIDQALHEIKRVMKPDGIFVSATNSLNSMPELQVLLRRAIVLLTRSGASQVRPPAPESDLFALENGSRQLAHYFYAVVRYDLPSALVFPSIDPVMAYLESTRSMREPQLPGDVLWDDVMMIMRQQITHLVNHLGELVINKLTGVLVASDRGGFIRSYVQHQENSHSNSH